MKTRFIMFSRNFPIGHPKQGCPTNFKEKLINGSKIHTIRENLSYWRGVERDLNSGEFLLSCRYWQGKPYHSKHEPFLNIFKIKIEISNYLTPIEIPSVAFNDGLTLEEFHGWFPKGIPEWSAIIHFTEHRYY